MRNCADGAPGGTGIPTFCQELAFPHLTERCKGFSRDFGSQSRTSRGRALFSWHRVDPPTLLLPLKWKRPAASLVGCGSASQSVSSVRSVECLASETRHTTEQ